MFLTCSFVFLFGQKPNFIKELDYIKIPEKHYKALKKYQKSYNKKYENLADDIAWDPRIHAVEDKGYHFLDKYFIPVTARGTNFSSTRILYWTGSCYQNYEVDGFALKSVSQVEGQPILIAEYDAGCCDFRYYAKGVFLFSDDTLKQVLVLPSFARSEPGGFPTVYSPELDFILQSRVECLPGAGHNCRVLLFTFWYGDPKELTEQVRYKMIEPNKIPEKFRKKMDLSIVFDASYTKIKRISIYGDVQDDFTDRLKSGTKNFAEFNPVRILKTFMKWMRK